jgi:opacity protein-like surface antigen
MKTSRFSIAMSCVAFACAAMGMQAAQAANVVDQSQLVADVGVPFVFSALYPNYPVGQSFTAGLAGRLSNIMLATNGPILDGTNSLTLEVRDGDGLTGTLLGTKTLAALSVYSPSAVLYVLDLNTKSMGINIESGHHYTFEITNVSGSGDLALRGVIASSANPYANGRIFAGPGYGTPPWDLVFQTSISAVPEPETYGMLLAGLGIVAFVSRRRKVGH